MRYRTRSENNHQLWAKKIAAWKTSGLTQRAYCDQHQLVYSTFVYWRGRLKQFKADDHASGKVSFLPVTLKHGSSTTLTLRINDQHSVEITPGFDPDLLGKVIQAVQKVA